jgi:hypothetical protein
MSLFTIRYLKILKSESSSYAVPNSCAAAIVISPFLIVTLFTVFGASSSTRPAVLWILRENGPVEILTFAVFLISSFIGLIFVRTLRNTFKSFSLLLFFSIFSFLLFIIAMEEIAWGQWFFGFDSPDFFREYNKQGETTLHNIGFLQGRSEFLRFSFGIGGIFTLLFSPFSRYRELAVPLLLIPYFFIITFLSGVDLYGDFFNLPEIVDRGTARLSEVVELLIAFSACLYLLLKLRTLTHQSGSSRTKPNPKARPRDS